MDFPPRPPREAPPRPPREVPPEPTSRVRVAQPSPDRGRPATARRPRRPPRETLARIGVAIPWIALAVFIVAVGGIPFALAMIGFAIIGMSELFRMTRDFKPMVPVAFAAAAALVIAAYYGDQFQIVLVGVFVFPALFAFALLRGFTDGVTRSMAITVLAITWIAVPFAHAVLLRDLPLHGGALVIDVLVATFVTDTAAYAGGRLFGRRPLAPRLSPNKTFEGLLSGLAGGTFGFWFAGLYQNWLTGVDALIIGFCVAALAPVGDLFASL